MRSFSRLLALTVLLLTPPVSRAAEDISRADLDNALHSTVLIQAYVKLPGSDTATLTIGEGSGSVLNSEGWILTNAHNILYTWSEVNEEQDTLLPFDDTLRTADGWLVYYADDPKRLPVYLCEAELRSCGTRRSLMDFAVLQCKTTANSPPFRYWLDLGNSDELAPGQDIYVVGYPDFSDVGAGATVTSWNGKITNFVPPEEGTGSSSNPAFGTSATISNGNSGGAAIDLDGKLIGVPTFGRRGGAGMHGYVLAINSAKPMIDEAVGARDEGVPVGGWVTDGATGRGIIGAVVVVLKAGASCSEVVRGGVLDHEALSRNILANAMSLVDGRFDIPHNLPAGSYSVIVAAKDYLPSAQDGVVRVTGTEGKIDVALKLAPVR